MPKFLKGTIAEYAAALGLTKRKAQERARAGEVPGARKVGGQWQVPLTTRQAADARGISQRTAQRQGRAFPSAAQAFQPKSGLKKNWVRIAENHAGYWQYLPNKATHTEQSAKDYMLGIARKGPAAQKHREARKRFRQYVTDQRKFWSWARFDKYVSTDTLR